MMGLFSKKGTSKAPKEPKTARGRKSLGSNPAPATGKDWPSLSPVPSVCHAGERGSADGAAAAPRSPRELIASFVPAPDVCTAEAHTPEGCAATPATDFAECIEEDPGEGCAPVEASDLSATLARLEVTETHDCPAPGAPLAFVGESGRCRFALRVSSVKPEPCWFPARLRSQTQYHRTMVHGSV